MRFREKAREWPGIGRFPTLARASVQVPLQGRISMPNSILHEHLVRTESSQWYTLECACNIDATIVDRLPNPHVQGCIESFTGSSAHSPAMRNDAQICNFIISL